MDPRAELKVWLSGVLEGLVASTGHDVPSGLIDRLMKRIDTAYGAPPTAAYVADQTSVQYRQPVAPTAPPPSVDDVQTKFPPRRKGAVAQAATKTVPETRKGDPLKAPYKPEDPEVLMME